MAALDSPVASLIRWPSSLRNSVVLGPKAPEVSIATREIEKDTESKKKEIEKDTESKKKEIEKVLKVNSTKEQ